MHFVDRSLRDLCAKVARGASAALLIVWVSGCGPATAPRHAGDAPASASALPTLSSRAEAETVRIPFVDLDSFDRQVERALASGATEIEIQLLAGMSPNQISPRLGRWINTVQENGGEVSVSGGPRTRSFGLLASLGEAVYAAWKELRLRNLVKGVDAEMALSGEKIQRVTLRRK